MRITHEHDLGSDNYENCIFLCLLIIFFVALVIVPHTAAGGHSMAKHQNLIITVSFHEKINMQHFHIKASKNDSIFDVYFVLHTLIIPDVSNNFQEKSILEFKVTTEVN